LSVPVWGTTLSGPLPVVGLVRSYRTNYLMGRSPLPQPQKFRQGYLFPSTSCGISSPFRQLSPAEGQVSYVLRTRSPLSTLLHSVRLACIRHAASVHPEPGSNSPLFLRVYLSRHNNSAEALLHGFLLPSTCRIYPASSLLSLCTLAFLHYSLGKVPTVGDKKPALLVATGFRTDILRTCNAFRLFSVPVASSDFSEFVPLTTRPHSAEWGRV
jgi:hypothetical protein